MSRIHRRTVVFVLVLAFIPALATAAHHGPRTVKARVKFIATSWMIRGIWGPNEDTYLAQLLLPKQNKPVLVRLVDAYPNEWPPLTREVLTSNKSTVISVKRDAE